MAATRPNTGTGRRRQSIRILPTQRLALKAPLIAAATRQGAEALTLLHGAALSSSEASILLCRDEKVKVVSHDKLFLVLVVDGQGVHRPMRKVPRHIQPPNTLKLSIEILGRIVNK